MSQLGSTSRLHTQRPFVSRWKTDNVGETTESNQVRLPVISTGNYACRVDWGDGSISDINYYSNEPDAVDNPWIHTYDSTGTYTISIYGIFWGFCFNNGGDNLKLLSISQWGSDFRLGNRTGGGYFYGCSNLQITAQDVLNTTGLNDFSNAFKGCFLLSSIPNLAKWNTASITTMAGCFFTATSFSGTGIGSWNVSRCTDFSYMFSQAFQFTADISSWNMSRATNLNTMLGFASLFSYNLGSWDLSSLLSASGMFFGSSMSKSHYNATLAGWAKATTHSGVTFSGGSSHYDSSTGGNDGTAGRLYLTGTKGWTITDGGTP